MDNIKEGDFEYASGWRCAEEFLEKKFVENHPLAIFCFNDIMCLGAVKCIKDLGL